MIGNKKIEYAATVASISDTEKKGRVKDTHIELLNVHGKGFKFIIP